MRRVFWVFAALVVVFDSSPAILARTVEFQTIQVTTPDVALSPDGTTLIFTLAGHLFRLPAEGGTAEQLTFGPNYDSEPVFSPDGSQVAFTSDRDGSDGNIFLLRLEDRQVLQLTRQEHAGRPIWAPDGKAITYLIYSAFPGPAHLGPPALLARISLEGEKPETLSAEPKPIRSAFYLMDGRLAWSLIELDSQSSDYVTRIEAMAIDGTTVSLRTVRGMADCISSTPKGDGLYCQRLVGLDQWIPLEDGIVFVPLPSGSEREIGPISSGRRSLSRFDRSADGKSIYLGNEGRLWRVHPTGASEPISFHADVKLELQEITSPTRALVREDGSVRAILSPRLSPDGRTFVFGAAGFLWRQPLEEGKAQRIYHGEAMEGEPAFSPDGRQLAFVRTQHGTDSLLLLNLSGSQARILTTGPSISEVAWSPDGQRLVALVGVFDQSVMTFSVVDGKSAVIAPAGSWSPRPQLSSDGNWLYYSSDATGIGNLYRVKLSKDAKPEQITHFSRHLSDGRISSDSKWLVFHRNRTILVAPFGSKLIQDSDIRELSAEGGDTFELTPDSSSVIYSVGNSVWQQPLAGGPRKEIPVRLDISRSVPPPLLLRGVRVLHLASGTFSSETSLLLEHGHILWIGNESSHHLPPGVSIVDASGRFAIPGLFDLHAHSEGANAEAFLAYGVTSLRDTGGALSWLNAMQDRSEFTSNAAPRYFYSGEIFEGEHPLWGDAFLQITNEQEAREYVRQFKLAGASFIKVYPSLSWKLKRTVAEEAHGLGLPVVGHGLSQEEITKSVTLGFFSVEHTPSQEYEDVLKMLAVSGTRWDPTLAVMGGDSLLLRDEPEQLTDPKFKAFTPESFIEFAMEAGYYRATATDALRGHFSSELSAVGRARHLGVTLLVGTDAPNPECFYGSSLQWELARFVEAGLSPAETLQLATEGAAAAVGAEDLGVITPGKLADIVLLKANPLENIRNTSTVWRVIKGGWLFDPAELPRIPSEASPVSGKPE